MKMLNDACKSIIIAWVAEIKYDTKLEWLSGTEADKINKLFLDSQDEYRIRIVILNYISMTGVFILTLADT